MQDLTNHPLYSQGTHLNNLPRLLLGLTQAQIPHIFLGHNPVILNQQEPPSLAIEILLSDQGFQKFHQIFVGQRFVPVDTSCQRCFWDSRTGLTLRILLPQDTSLPAQILKNQVFENLVLENQEWQSQSQELQGHSQFLQHWIAGLLHSKPNMAQSRLLNWMPGQINYA